MKKTGNIPIIGKQNASTTEEPVKQIIKDPIKNEQPEINPASSLEEDFKNFEKSTSEYKAMGEENSTTNIKGKAVNTLITTEQKVKIKLFLGFACFLLSGFNTFLFNMVFKDKVALDEMLLSDTEKEELQEYLNTPEVIAFIEKIPPYVIAIAHIEYMFYLKYRSAVKKKKQNPAEIISTDSTSNMEKVLTDLNKEDNQ